MATETSAIPEVVEVGETLTGKFTQRIQAGRHELTADEPVAVGGNDAGPGPYQLLLSALGACTSMTVRMYADMKKIPLKRISVKLSHRKVHAADCADCETKEGKIDEITREITLEGDLDAAVRQKLLDIANKCPVHRTLNSEIKIRTALTA